MQTPEAGAGPVRWWRGAPLLLLLLPGCASPPPPDPGLPQVLRWGGDSSGGEPYIITQEGQEPSGFEGDLAKYLGEKLGIPTKFVDNEWSSLPNDLRRGDIDVVLNGYEWMPARARVMGCTVPYYAYKLALLVRRDSPIKGWADLKKGRPRVGVLGDTAAERYLNEEFPNVSVEALETEGVTGVMAKVAGKQFDATVQDFPVARWYVQTRRDFPDLKVVGEPVRPVANSYYVIYLPRGAETLRAKLDEAIKEGFEDGSIKKIYERYGLWDEDQEALPEVIAKEWPPNPDKGRPDLSQRAWEMLQAAGVTVVLSCLAMPLAIAIGLIVAVGRLYGPRWLGVPLAVYVEVTRGTPVLVQLIVLYYYLPDAIRYYFPEVAFQLPAFWTGVIGLALNYGAYEAENYRAGLLAIPRGQMEAALALGMSRWTALRRIIVPQAVRLVVPPVTNDFISLFKDSSICSVISVKELSRVSRTLSSTNPGAAVELALMTAALYLLMSYPLSLLSRRLERKQQQAH